METPFSSRRHFLASTGLLLAAPLWADKRPPVTNPKATSGDAVAEPDWEKRLSISVGPKKADLVGTNEKVLQAAVDYMARMGGGTVQVLPGEYRLRNAVHLRNKVRILGSGADRGDGALFVQLRFHPHLRRKQVSITRPKTGEP